ncbi:calcium-independent phospholipase A2 [Fusarium phyllophilum]|uniref:Calcium-independent phospholipase A2 n=1 Tax=Fusarium phyllophilum TaxID=47803 RepID=A0A8H5K9D0_9HYPO|nr:calcium-independent phospholipase A2 [Fusarium phyllophilum]
MLGRLQMGVDECISAYNELIKVVFNEKARAHQSKFSLLGQTQARFDSGGPKAAIEKTLKDRGLSPTDSMFDSCEPNCKVFVCATSKLDAAVCRFRSYNSHKSSVSATICQAARATSAATTFFNPVSIGGMKFVDGALGANNPGDQVEEEATEIWCPSTGNLQPLVKCCISIGTGRLPAYNIDDRVDKFIGTLAKMATDAEKIAEASNKRWRQHFEQGRYFRFNVENGLQTSSSKFLGPEMRLEPNTEEEECSAGFGTFNHDRPIYLRNLQAAFSQDGHQRAALTGLGGTGKTQIAIQFAEWLHTSYPEASVFWISGDRIQQSYSDIAQKLDLYRRCHHEFKSPDARVLFQRYLSTESLGRWFLIIDDADADGDLLSPVTQPESVLNDLPKSKEGRDLLRSPSQDAFPFILQKPDGGGQGSDCQDPILKSMTKSFEAVRNDNPHAGKLLEFISQIGPSSIPRTIFPDLQNKERRSNLELSIGTLCNFFLLVPRQGGTMFDMPTIVHICTRVWVKQKKASRGLTEMVTKRINELVPPVDWSKRLIWKKYQSHALRILTSCQNSNLKFDERFQLTCKVGAWLFRERHTKEAVLWLQQSLEWAKKSSFKYTKRRLRIQLDLAEAYAETEQSEKAIQVAEKALDFQEKHLSKDDSSALAVPCVLAKSHRFNGAPKHGIDRLEKLRKADSKASAMDRLVLLGEHKKSIALLEETLPIQQEILGKSHFDTLKIQAYLIEQYSKIKDLIKAISHLEELLPIQRKALGQVHKKTMSSENNLAELKPRNPASKNADERYSYTQKLVFSSTWAIYSYKLLMQFNMPVRSLYLAKSGGGANQRSHFALFIPNAEYDRDTISEDFQSVKAIGTRIHVVGEPLMSGFAFEIHRNYNTKAYPDLKQLVFLGKIDDSLLHEYPKAEPEIRENTARSLIERVAESVAPPPKGQNLRAPVDGVHTKRCQEWTMEVLALLSEKQVIPSEAVSIAQRERDPPTKGIFGYKN